VESARPDKTLSPDPRPRHFQESSKLGTPLDGPGIGLVNFPLGDAEIGGIQREADCVPLGDVSTLASQLDCDGLTWSDSEKDMGGQVRPAIRRQWKWPVSRSPVMRPDDGISGRFRKG
jgi:hypothetical protein